ncbi:hypothetical protein AAMO2058_001405700 [Amorphochlora amoebiformis]
MLRGCPLGGRGRRGTKRREKSASSHGGRDGEYGGPRERLTLPGFGMDFESDEMAGASAINSDMAINSENYGYKQRASKLPDWMRDLNRNHNDLNEADEFKSEESEVSHVSGPREDHQGEGMHGVKLSVRQRKKRDRLDRKLERNPETFPILQTSIKDWDIMRDSRTPKKESKALASSISLRMSGSMSLLSQSRTGSLILQSCLKHGGEDVWIKIFRELKNRIPFLARGRYSCPIVEKLLIYSPDKRKKHMVVNKILGRTTSLLRHRFGSRAVDSVYYHATKNQKDIMMSEFYGCPVEEACFQGHIQGLEKLRIIHGNTSETWKSIYTSVYVKLVQIWDKGLISPFIVHKILWEYTQVSSPEAIYEMVLGIARNCMFLKMMHTREGALVAVQVIKTSPNFKLKQISLELKNQMLSTACHPFGCWVLLALLKYAEPRLIRRIIVPELIQNLEAILETNAGQLVFATLLSGNAVRYIGGLEGKWIEAVDETSKSVRALHEGWSRQELEHLEEGEQEKAALAAEQMVIGEFGVTDKKFKEREDKVVSMGRGWETVLMDGGRPGLESALLTYSKHHISSLLTAKTNKKNILYELLARSPPPSNASAGIAVGTRPADSVSKSIKNGTNPELSPPATPCSHLNTLRQQLRERTLEAITASDRDAMGSLLI